MSVTFYIKDAPSHTEQVECYCVYNGVAESGCYACSGAGTREEAVSDGEPSLNLANGNAVAILTLLGITGDDTYSGEIQPQDVPAMRRKILVLRNSEKTRSSAARDYQEFSAQARASVNSQGVTCITTGPKVIMCGIDDEYISSKLERLDTLLAEAASLGKPLIWN